ncbi:Clp protease, partial [Bacillus thuringiensis]|nr:Clp protease [Bacillus thuringiensis]
TAETAKSYGFCDEIVDSIKSVANEEPVIEESEEEVPIENEGDKRIQNAEKSANFMASLLKSIQL